MNLMVYVKGMKFNLQIRYVEKSESIWKTYNVLPQTTVSGLYKHNILEGQGWFCPQTTTTQTP